MMLKLTNYDVQMATALSASIDYGCHFDMCALVSIMMVKDKERKEFFVKPFEKEKLIDYEKKKNIFLKEGVIFLHISVCIMFFIKM